MPVRVRYASAGGVGEVYAGSYRLDVAKLTVSANRIRLYVPGEPTSVSIEKLELQQIGPVQQVKASGVAARVVREANGQVDLQRFGLKPTGKPDTSLVRVDVDSAKFYVLDATAKDPRWQTVLLTSTHAEGAMGNWTGRSTVCGLSLSNLPVSFNIPVSGPSTVATVANNHDLAPAVRILSAGGYLNVRGLDAEKLVVTGPASVTIDGDKIISNGDVYVKASGLNYPGWAKNLALSGRLTGAGDAWTGDVQANAPGISAKFQGRGTMGSTPSLDGALVASLDRLESLPTNVAKLIPSDLHASKLLVSGRVGYEKNQPLGQVDVSVDQAAYQKNVVTGIRGQVACSNGSCTLVLNQATVNKGLVEGRVRYRLSDQSLSGFARTKGNASVLVSAYLPKEMTLDTKAVVLVSGTVKRPLVSGYAEGTGTYRISEGRTIRLERAAVRATEDSGQLRVVFDGATSAGRIRATGSVKNSYRDLDLTVHATGLDLSAVDPTYAGKGRAWGTVTGPIDSPVVDGRIEAVNLNTAEITVPAFAGIVHYQNHKLSIVDAVAMAKGGLATGSGSIDLNSRSIEGKFEAKGLSLSELGLGNSFGRIDVTQGQVAGTLDHPEATAQAHAKDAYLARYKIDEALALVHLKEGQVRADNLLVKAAQGVLTGQGQYRLDDQSWSALIDASKFPLERLRLDLAGANPTGLVGLKAKVSGKADKVDQGTAEVRLDDITAFSQPVGSGMVNADVVGKAVSATGQIGDLDKRIDITSASYDLDSGATRFVLDASEVKLGRILQALALQNRDWSPDLRSTFDRVDAVVSAHVEGENVSDGRFHFRVPVLEARDITIDSHPAGVIEANAENSGDTFKLNSLSWRHRDAVATAFGTYTNHGPVSGELSITNLTAETLTSLVPRIPVRDGRLAELTVSLSGTADDPIGRASATLNQVTLADSRGNPIPAPLDISIFDASLVNKVVTVDGAFNVTAAAKDKVESAVAGLSGTLKATAPLDAFKAESSEEYSATIQLSKPRPASLLAQFVPGLDPKRTAGEITGGVTVHGKANETHFQGTATLGPAPGGPPAKLEFTDGSFAINNLNANLTLSETGARLVATGTTGDNQPARLDLGASYPDVIANGFSLDELRTSTFLSGTSTIDTDFRSTLPGASKPSSAHIAAQLQLGGVLQRPEVSGQVDVSKGSFSLPLFFATATGGGEPPVDPRFNIALNLAPGTKIDAPLASLTLSQAQGTLGGSLSDPSLRMPLSVESGIVRLPTSRIRIDAGSKVTVALDQGGTPRLDLDVTGHANYTKRITESVYQTYDLSLQIKGNLIYEDPLAITGQSDPVGLSQDEIQAFVTQRGLIETLVNTATGSSSASNTQSALYSVAVPSLSGFLTDPVAEALGLDFLTLDYNPFDQTVISAGKTFGRRLTLTFTRQLVAPINGLPRQDIRLSYAFPTRDRFLSQLRLNLIKTQLTPWRLGLSFGGRF